MAASLKDGSETVERKIAGQNTGWKGTPPAGRVGGAGKADASEQARVLKHQGTAMGIQDQVVVLGGLMTRRFRGEFSGHAQVHPQPMVGVETEQHLFPMGLDGAQGFAWERLTEVSRMDSAKYPFARVQMNTDHFFIQPGKPTAAEIKYFGEFRHRARVRR